MGVKLTDIVPRKEIGWDVLSGKVLALDASNVLYQFLSSIRQPDGTLLMDSKGRVTSHLVGLFSRTTNLIEKGVKPAFVFDGKPPALKGGEIERRRGRKEKAAEKYEEAKEEGDESSMLKYSRQSIKLTKEMAEEAKELVSALGLPVVQAPSEAEAQAAFICKRGDAWAVASQDYDALLFGAPRVVQNLTLAERRKLPNGTYAKVTPALIELQETLSSLSISQEQLLSLAILVGTDFNPGGVKGIGAKKALKLVSEFNTREDIFRAAKAEFDYREIAGVFSDMPVKEDYSVEFMQLDEERVKKILVDKHGFSVERVDSGLERLRAKKEESKGQTSLLAFGR
ncbi:MAG TPA: flap endonuclease-1 [Nanoarchaeota archaeon]|nr:flap endonuclease-1 [Nanoarchaeota archaeon]